MLKNLESKVDLLSKFLNELQKETDREASILAGSILDQMLKDILFDFLIDCQTMKDLLSGNNTPVGTLVRNYI